MSKINVNPTKVDKEAAFKYIVENKEELGIYNIDDCLIVSMSEVFCNLRLTTENIDFLICQKFVGYRNTKSIVILVVDRFDLLIGSLPYSKVLSTNPDIILTQNSKGVTEVVKSLPWITSSEEKVKVKEVVKPNYYLSLAKKAQTDKGAYEKLIDYVDSLHETINEYRSQMEIVGKQLLELVSKDVHK